MVFPPNHPILIGFSIIFTIHFGGIKSPYFWFNTHIPSWLLDDLLEVGITFWVVMDLGANSLNTRITRKLGSAPGCLVVKGLVGWLWRWHICGYNNMSLGNFPIDWQVVVFWVSYYHLGWGYKFVRLKVRKLLLLAVCHLFLLFSPIFWGTKFI